MNFIKSRGPLPHYQGTQRVRACLGLTQQNLADLLDVSRTSLAMHERTGRALPLDKLARMLPLYPVLPAPGAPAPAPVTPVLSDDDRKTLSWRQRELAAAIFPLEEELAQCEVRLAQARLAQQALPALRAAFAATDEAAHTWLSSLEIKTRRTLRKASGTPALLGLRLATLRFEATEIARLLGAGQ